MCLGRRFTKISGCVAIASALLFSSSCRPDTSTDILPEINFLISLHPDVITGLVGYWPLDGNAKNFGSTGSAADGVLVTANSTNLPAPCADRRGNAGAAFCFDSTNFQNYINIPYNSQLDFDTNQDFTISAWAQMPSGGSAGPILSKDTSSSYSYSLRALSGEGVNALRRDNNLIVSGVYSPLFNPADNLYRHYLFMKSGSSLYLYINGSLSGTSPDTLTGSALSALNAYIGYDGSLFYSGAIDDVRIYNRTLTDREIQILYNY